MNDIRDTIASYENSCSLLRERIHQLSGRIAEAKGGRGSGNYNSLQPLLDRRYLLYSEVWEMQDSIRSMRDYVKETRKSSPEAGRG